MKELSDEELIAKLRHCDYEVLDCFRESDPTIRDFIAKHRMQLQRIPMGKMEVLHAENSIRVKVESVRMAGRPANDMYFIDTDKFGLHALETNPDELIIDDKVLAMCELNEEWINERRKVIIKNIPKSYETYVAMFKNCTHLTLNCQSTMKMETILSHMKNFVELKLTGFGTICHYEDLEKLMDATEVLEYLEIDLHPSSKIAANGLHRIIQEIYLADEAVMKFRNFPEPRLDVFGFLQEGAFIDEVIEREDHFEVRRPFESVIRVYVESVYKD